MTRQQKAKLRQLRAARGDQIINEPNGCPCLSIIILVLAFIATAYLERQDMILGL